MTRTPYRRAGLALVGALALVACGRGGGAETTTTVTTTTTTTTLPETTTSRVTTTTRLSTTTTTEKPVLRMPLTGVVIDSVDDIPNRPALVVKIDNHKQARPQSGLNEADIVYEENVEQITRFAAVFHSQGADPVGPIRSGRTQDVDLLGSLNRPLFAWSGGNSGVTKIIRESDLGNLDCRYTPGCFRIPGRVDLEHTLYSRTDALWANTPEGWPSPPPQQFAYLDPGTKFRGRATQGVDVRMDGVRVSWEWNADQKLWLRGMDDQPHDDNISGRVSTNNVIVLVVEYRPSVVDRRSPEAQTIGTGEVWILAEGGVKHGKWERPTRLDTFKFTDDKGKRIELVPGRTFVELARQDTTALREPPA